MLKLKRKQELIMLILGGGLLAFLLISKLAVFKSSDVGLSKMQENNKETEEKKETNQKVYVYITGEIKKPGVYSLKTGDRLSDLVKAADGFTEKADMASINMAEKLKDEQHIVVQAREEQPVEGAKKGAIVLGKINVNIATAEEIDSFLPGIGSTLAKSIVDHREKNGKFKSVDDVSKVNGIGNGKRFEKIKGLIIVN